MAQLVLFSLWGVDEKKKKRVSRTMSMARDREAHDQMLNGHSMYGHSASNLSYQNTLRSKYSRKSHVPSQSAHWQQHWQSPVSPVSSDDQYSPTSQFTQQTPWTESDDEFREEFSDFANDHAWPTMDSAAANTRPVPSSLPPAFVMTFVRKCFDADLTKVQFPQSLTALDYLADLESRRRQELDQALHRLGIERNGLSNDVTGVLGNSPEVAAWLHSVEAKGKKIEALYTQLYVALRRWILINELSILPFNRINCHEMLDTLYPASLIPPPRTKLTSAILQRQREGWERYIDATEKHGPQVLGSLMRQGASPEQIHGWPSIHETLETYLNTADAVIAACSAVVASDSTLNTARQSMIEPAPRSYSMAEESFGQSQVLTEQKCPSLTDGSSGSGSLSGRSSVRSKGDDASNHGEPTMEDLQIEVPGKLIVQKQVESIIDEDDYCPSPDVPRRRETKKDGALGKFVRRMGMKKLDSEDNRRFLRAYGSVSQKKVTSSAASIHAPNSNPLGGFSKFSKYSASTDDLPVRARKAPPPPPPMPITQAPTFAAPMSPHLYEPPAPRRFAAPMSPHLYEPAPKKRAASLRNVAFRATSSIARNNTVAGLGATHVRTGSENITENWRESMMSDWRRMRDGR